MDKVRVQFYIYINQLSQYENKLAISIHSQEVNMLQRLELHPDIFFVEIEISRDRLSKQTKYYYFILGEKDSVTKEIQRNLSEYRVQMSNQTSCYMIFDTPEEFHIKQNVIKNLILDKNVILKQTNPTDSLLMFFQSNSTIDEMKCLLKFIKISRFENLYLKANEKIFQIIRGYLKDNPQIYLQGLKILEIDFKDDKYYEIFKDLSNFYKQQKLTMQTIGTEEQNQVIALIKRFQISQFLDEFMNESSILSVDIILQGLHQNLDQSTKSVIVNMFNLIQKLVKFQYPEESINQNKESFIQRYWIKYFQYIDDNDKINFLMKNSEIITQSFTNTSSQEFQHFIGDLLVDMTKSPHLIKLFISQIDQFIDRFDKKGSLMIQHFTQLNFERINEQIQIDLFTSLYKRGVLLNINLQQLILELSISIVSIESILEIFSLLLTIQPQLCFTQAILNIFKSKCQKLNGYESYKMLEYKINLLSLSQQQLALLNELKLKEAEEQINKKENVQNQNENENKDLVPDQVLKKNTTEQSFYLTQDDVNQLSSQMDEIILKKIAILSLEEIVELVSNVNRQEEFQIFERLINEFIKQKLNSLVNRDSKFLDEFMKFCQYSNNLNLGTAVQSNKAKVIHIIKTQYEEYALNKYNQSKHVNNPFLEDFTCQFLRLHFSQKFINQVEVDFRNQKIENLDIQTIEKLFQSTNFEEIYKFFQNEFIVDFRELKSKILNQIEVYKNERKKLVRFFERTQSYLEKDYQNFKNIFTVNQIYSQLNQVLQSFQHLQHMYEFLNDHQQSVIFNKIYLLVEEKLGNQQPKTQNILKSIFRNTQQNIIELVLNLTDPNERTYNESLLQQYNFQEENNSLIMEESNFILQKAHQSQIQYQIFGGNNSMTFTQLQLISGNTFKESITNICNLFNLIIPICDFKLLQVKLQKIYIAQLFFKYGSVFIDLSKIYKIDFSVRCSLDLKLKLENLQKVKKFEEQTLQKIIGYLEIAQLQELSDLLLGGDSYFEQVQLLKKLEVILSYRKEKLKLSSFLDLRDLVDEDSTDVISLLIKLNNYNYLLAKIEDFKQSMEKEFLNNFIKETLQFIKVNMNTQQIVIDLNDSINDFDKILNISQTFDKKKQFISLTCDIIEQGQFSLVFDEKNSDVQVKVICQKEYSEQEMRQVCSKIILEQTTKTNNLISVAQANIQNSKQNQKPKYRNFTYQLRDGKNMFNDLSNNNDVGIKDDYQIQNGFQSSQEEGQQELDKEINLLKEKMQKFRDQWFVIEQLKEVILNSIKYGSYAFLNQILNYNNSNGQYQNTYLKMGQDVKELQKNLSIWKNSLQAAFKQYPNLTLIGFSHFREMMKYIRSQIQTFSPDLTAILKQIEVEEKDFVKIKSNSEIDIIKHIGQCISKKQIGQQNMRLNFSQKSKIFQVKCQGNQIIEILVQKIKHSPSPIQYYQCFYYDNNSTIQDLELFMYRLQYLLQAGLENEYFLILNNKLDIKFYNQLNNILQRLLNEKDFGDNSLYILANKELIKEEITIIPYLTVEQVLEPEKYRKDFVSNQFSMAKQQINFFYSDYPGAGKTFQIQKIQGIIRVPINGSSEKTDFIQLMRNKIVNQKQNTSFSIHLDMYEMLNLDINYLLFELIFLNSLSIHSRKYLYIGSQAKYYIEIQNNLNQEFFKNISIKQYFNQTKVEFNIKQYQIQHQDLNLEEQVCQFMSFKYLQVIDENQRNPNCLDKKDLSNIKHKKNDSSYQGEFQNLLQNWFVSKIQQQNIQPCYYKLSHFVKLFGSEMSKFENCFYVQFHILRQEMHNLLDLGLRTYIVITSYNLSLAVSVNKLNNQNLIMGNNLTKAQQLHNKAQQIQKFNSNMMNFVTFQEQDNPCITTFFDKQEQVPKCINELVAMQKEQLIFFDHKNRPEALLKWLIMLIHQNDSKVYRDPNNIEFTNIMHAELQKLVQRITIQKDNFFKIAMIFMRIRSNTPIIIMGQSGIGKTALIELMSLIMDAVFITMNIHAGITEKDIVNKINQIKTGYNQNQKIILFFDEVNTNKLIGGLFKEILVDRCIKGEKINKNIIPIAAINPYKLKSEKQRQIIDLQIHGGIKKDIVDKIKNTDLEYMVEPIPESLYSFIWNFDSLDQQDEKNYITQMLIIKNQMKLKKKSYQTHKFKQDDLLQISEAIFFAQQNIRSEMGYQSACSLRDVNRFNKLLFWFVKNLQIFKTFGLNIRSITQYSICMAFFINYAVRLPLSEKRYQFLIDCCQKFNIKQEQTHKIIDEVLTYLTDQTEVPQGIVKNTALKSNIFTLFVCIMNKIPIVLIGPPGCSKSLSLSILIKTMKGEQSRTQFFKQYKTIMQLFYQGHIQSTSERIQEVFDNAIQKQNKIIKEKQSKKYLTLVQIEEIGLAEISPDNPLKVLHSVLEKPKISVACISNWPLDQSKMNRMLAAYRLNVSQSELKETIECIQNQMIEQEKDQFVKDRLVKNSLSPSSMEQISKIYLEYLRLVKLKDPAYEQFHGLRDFYAMAKLICYKQFDSVKKDLNENQNKIIISSNQLTERIFVSFARHFSGLKQSRERVKQALEAVYPQAQLQKVFWNQLTDLSLIDENLQENSSHYISRNLMIITEKPQFATDYISRRLTALNRPYQLLLGGDFNQDQTTENSHSIINQIISCVESGIVVVLQNLESIYQSLYELLNQNFRELNGKPYCKISFGADSSNIQIGQGFKLILVQQFNQIHRMDGPLLNRFEKHLFNEGMTLDTQAVEQLDSIYKYFESRKLLEQFNFQNFKDVLQTLVIQQIDLNKQKENASQYLDNDSIIEIIYRLMPLSKQLNYIDKQDEIFKKKVFATKYHFSLEQFIQDRILGDKDRMNGALLSNLITIYSPSFCISKQIDCVKLRIELQDIQSQQKLIDTLNRFFKQEFDYFNHDNSVKVIMVVTDMFSETLDKLVLVRQKISESFLFMQKRLPKEIQQNFYALITVKTNDQFNILPYQNNWSQYYLEDLFPLYFIPANYSQLRDQFSVMSLFQKKQKNLLEVVNLDDFVNYFISVQEYITNSYSLIDYKQINREGYKTKRLSQIWQIFKNVQFSSTVKFLMQILKERIKNQLQSIGVQTVDDFIEKCVLQKKHISQTQSLSKAIWLGFIEIAQQGLAMVIFVLEKYNLLYMLYDQSNNNLAIQIIQNKLLEIFGLEAHNFNAFTGIYSAQVSFNKLQITNRFELDSDKLDLQFYESENIYSIINRAIANVDLPINGITFNEQQETNKLNKFKEVCAQIEKTLIELCQKNELEACSQLQQQFLNDFYKYLKSNITQCQKSIIQYLLLSPMLNFKNNENKLDQVIKQASFCYFYSSDLMKIEDILTHYIPFLGIGQTMKEYIQMHSNQVSIRQFLIYLVNKIYYSIYPSKQVFQIVKQNKIDYQKLLSQLVQFIDLYQLQVKQNDMLQTKQNLLLLSCFIQEVIKGLSVNLKILNFVNLEFFQNLEESYLDDLKIQLRNLYQLDINLQSQILNINDFEFPYELFDEQSQKVEFDLKWNKFLLEIIYSSIKCRERIFCPDYTRQLFKIVHQIELFYVNNKQSIPTTTLIKFNLIMNELSCSIQSEEIIFQIFQSDSQQQIISTHSTEFNYLVILSNALQQNVIKNSITTIVSSQYLLPIIYNCKLKELTQLQKLIYLGVFRHVVQHLINLINKQVSSYRQLDYSLKQYFTRLNDFPLQLYVAKSFYNQYKQGDIMVQKINSSPYFKESAWLKKFCEAFKGLLSSSFLSEPQMLHYKEYFENKKDGLKNILKTYLAQNLKQSQNVFGNLFNGRLNKSTYYPYMMYNNIYLFHRDSQNNKQLYKCKNCQEYIFSNACPHLQSVYPCLQCGKLIQLNNQYTEQVLTEAQSKQQQLEGIKISNQWMGFYIRLEDDTPSFKLDQGTSLDLRIFALLYYLSMLLAFEVNKKYNTPVSMIVYSMKQKREITINTKEINRNLRIHYEADPVKFMNEQIDIALSHITNIMRQMYNISEIELAVILFKITNELINNNQIRECSQNERANLNAQLSQQISAVIKKSQQVILESKSEHVEAILEKNNPNEQIISENYLRNLRSTELNLSNEFIQTYIKQNLKNNEFKILKEFLDLPKFLYLSQGLRFLLYFTQQVNNLFIKRFTKKNAQSITLLEALNNQKNHPLYKFYNENLIPIWKEIKEREIEYQIGCQSHQIQQITEKTKLSDLLFTGDKQFGQFPNVLELIVNQQNNFMNKIYQLSLLENSEEFTKLKKIIQNFMIDHSSKEKDKLNELPIQNIDVSKNVIKQYNKEIFILYFLSDLEYGKGLNYIYDFRLLQEEMTEQVLEGVVQINLELSQKFFFLSEINQIGLLSNNTIDQEQIPLEIKEKMKGLFQSKTKVYELLQQLSTVFQMFKSEKNQGNLSIESALLQLQIRQSDIKIMQCMQDLKLIHLNDSIKFLEEMNMDELVELCNPAYQMKLDSKEIEQVIAFLEKSVTLQNFRIALGRFILRCLSQDSENINPKTNLFEQIFYVDIYEELWNDTTNVEAQYENAMKHKIVIGQSYELYKHISNKLDKKKLIANIFLPNKAPSVLAINRNYNENKMMMENFSDDVFKKNIKDIHK